MDRLPKLALELLQVLVHEAQDNAKCTGDDMSNDFIVSCFLDETSEMLKKCDLSLTCAQPRISHADSEKQGSHKAVRVVVTGIT